MIPMWWWVRLERTPRSLDVSLFGGRYRFGASWKKHADVEFDR